MISAPGRTSVVHAETLLTVDGLSFYFEDEPGRRSAAKLLSQCPPVAFRRPLALTRLAQRSRSHEPLPKNSNNSPRHMISQNNSIVISVCTLAFAARFRANAGPKSVGMICRPHAHPSCAGTTPTGPLQFPFGNEVGPKPRAN